MIGKMMRKEDITPEHIQVWLKKYLVDHFQLEKSFVHPSTSFDALGLDSVKQVELIGAIEDWLGIKIEPTLAYDYPTIAALSSEVALHMNRHRE